jgi:hypothetical protein
MTRRNLLRSTAQAVRTGALLAGFGVLLMAPAASAAGPVVYTVSPTSGSVQPDSTIDIQLSFKTDVQMAGGSVHLDIANGAYANFQTASTPAISFTDYHAEQNDVVYICSNNVCEPGTYQIATITVKAAASGTMKVNFVPKETADPDLALIGADGATSSITINSSAPASPAPKKPSQNTFTIPKDDGNGGTAPLVVSNDQYQSQLVNAQTQNFPTVPEEEETGSKSFWTFKNVAIGGLGIGIGLGIILLIIVKFFIKPPGSGGIGPMGPSGPSTPGGNGAIFG